MTEPKLDKESPSLTPHGDILRVPGVNHQNPEPQREPDIDTPPKPGDPPPSPEDPDIPGTTPPDPKAPAHPITPTLGTKPKPSQSRSHNPAPRSALFCP